MSSNEFYLVLIPQLHVLWSEISDPECRFIDYVVKLLLNHGLGFFIGPQIYEQLDRVVELFSRGEYLACLKDYFVSFI